MEHFDSNTIQFLPRRPKQLPEDKHQKRRVRRRIEELQEDIAIQHNQQWWRCPQ